MIIGLLTLFSILFFGGSQDSFFVEKLDKGVKKYVLEKDRKKDILMEIKEVKSTVKMFNKERKKQLKTLKSLNLSYTSSKVDFESFYEELTVGRIGFQKKVLEQRIGLVSKIKDNEWQKILGLSDESVDKQQQKEKNKKQKELFFKVEKTILNSIQEKENQSLALEYLEKLKKSYSRLLKDYKAVNTIENSLIRDKNATLEAGLAYASKLNQVRKEAYFALVDFHFELKEVSSESSWSTVMKSINKDLK